MSVLLINPPPLEPVPARLLTPPLGLAYLAASLRARGLPSAVLDADALDLSLSQIAAVAVRAKPRIIGVTAMTPTVESAYRVLEALRPLAPLLVLGGPHASALGARVFEDCPVPLDAVVCGEAEETFSELARRALAGEPLAGPEIPGVLLPDGKASARDWPKIADLDRLPFPDRGSLPSSRYRHPLFGGQAVTSLITSRGCPYRCVFCDKHICGVRWRARSPENVLAELQEMVLKSGLRRIIIYDDLFTLDRERVIAICRGIIRLGLRLRFKCEGRVNRVDPEMLAWMKRAGCEMIAYGVETAAEKGLAFLKKDITVTQAREAFAMTRDAGVKTLGYFLLGIPGETREDELETIRLAIELGADYAQFGVLSPFPGTPLQETAMARGWLHELPARGPAERGRRPVILDGYWTLPRLDEIVRQAHRRFYFRPGYLLKRLARLNSPGELLALSGQGLRLAGWWLRSKRGGN